MLRWRIRGDDIGKFDVENFGQQNPKCSYQTSVLRTVMPVGKLPSQTRRVPTRTEIVECFMFEQHALRDKEIGESLILKSDKNTRFFGRADFGQKSIGHKMAVQRL